MFINRLKVTSLLVYFTTVGVVSHAQQDNDFFSKFPANTVFNISEAIGDFKQIVCELPEGINDTVWVKRLLTPPMWKVQADVKDENLEVVSEFWSRNENIVVKNISYPLDALKKEKEGKIEATCIVEEDGSLTNIEITTPIHPSIDTEALRFFSEVKLLPCRIGTKALRCRHQVSILFEIMNKESKNKYGRILIANADKLPEGVSKRFRHSVTWKQTTTQTKTDPYGFRDSRSWISGCWHTSLKIDVPKNNPDFEKVLCKTIYNKSGKSIEVVGPKFAKSFQGKLKDKFFKKKSGDDLSITAKCLSYQAGRYYSYGYETTLKPSLFSKESYTVIHNIIYDIQAKRILTINDVLRKNEIMALGLNDKETYDLGLNKHFLYIGQQGEGIADIAITQENWHKFSPIFQALLGNKQSYPMTINKDDYICTDLMGIQPQSITQKIVMKPTFIVKGENLRSFINKNIDIPVDAIKRNKDLTAIVSYIIEKDGSISNVEVTQTDGGIELRDEIVRIFTTMPKWQPLLLSGNTAIRTYNMFKYNFSLTP